MVKWPDANNDKNHVCPVPPGYSLLSPSPVYALPVLGWHLMWWVIDISSVYPWYIPLHIALYNDTDIPSLGSGGLVAMEEMMVFNFLGWVIQVIQDIDFALSCWSAHWGPSHYTVRKPSSHTEVHTQCSSPSPWLAVNSHLHIWDAGGLWGFLARLRGQRLIRGSAEISCPYGQMSLLFQFTKFCNGLLCSNT